MIRPTDISFHVTAAMILLVSTAQNASSTQPGAEWLTPKLSSKDTIALGPLGLSAIPWKSGVLGIHSWYPAACCQELDCAPAAAGTIRRTASGWHLLDSNELIPFNDPRVQGSLDDQFHRCRMIFWDSNSRTKCLFVPSAPAISQHLSGGNP